MDEPKLRILNLGAGVQSSTLAMLATRGVVKPMPDAAIFADTGWEPAAVYQYLEWLTPQLAFPTIIVKGHRSNHSGKGIRVDVVASAEHPEIDGGVRFGGMPLYTESKNGGGVLRRYCTTDYKIEPIERQCRKMLCALSGGTLSKPLTRVPAGAYCEQWFGISRDELYRVKDSPTKWIKRRWPLVFELGWTRYDCLAWWDKEGMPRPPRSACIGCPYHSDKEWREMKETRPEEWQDAVEFDRIIRSGVRGTKEKCYLHRSLKPLDEVDLRSAEDMGQMSLFTSECEGMCGV